MLANSERSRNNFVAKEKKLTATGFLSATGDNKAKLRVVAMFCKSVNKHSFFVLSFVARKSSSAKKHGKKNHVDSGEIMQKHFIMKFTRKNCTLSAIMKMKQVQRHKLNEESICCAASSKLTL